jgi:hypothetical protein
MTIAHTPPASLTPDASGFVRIDRSSCFCQILLTLSEDEARPTKAATLHRLLGFSEQAVRDSLATLVAHGFIQRVSTGHYVRRWAPIPGIES